MKTIFCIFFGLTFILFGLGCRKAMTQAESKPPGAMQVKDKQAGTEINTNPKYGLSLIFHNIADEKSPSIEVIVRNDKTGQESDLYTIAEDNLPQASRKLWSPNGEFLILHNNALSIYKTTELLKFMRQSNFNMSDFLRKAGLTQSIEIITDKQNSEFRHTFSKWEDDNSFSFKISHRNREDATKYDEIGEFRYDFVKRSLFRRIKQNYENLSSLKEKQDYVILSSLLGRDKTGLISPNNIKNELLK